MEIRLLEVQEVSLIERELRERGCPVEGDSPVQPLTVHHVLRRTPFAVVPWEMQARGQVSPGRPNDVGIDEQSRARHRSSGVRVQRDREGLQRSGIDQCLVGTDQGESRRTILLEVRDAEVGRRGVSAIGHPTRPHTLGEDQIGLLGRTVVDHQNPTRRNTAVDQRLHRRGDRRRTGVVHYHALDVIPGERHRFFRAQRSPTG